MPLDRGRDAGYLVLRTDSGVHNPHTGLFLYRQAQMQAHESIVLERSTIFDAASGVCRLLTLLVKALRHDVLVPAKQHRDAIPVPMLALSEGNTKTRRLWAGYAITGRQESVQPLWFGSLTRQTAKASIQEWSQAQSAWLELEWF